MQMLDEGFERVLAVVAHPDDLEYGASAAVARWTAAGTTVGYVIVTDGEAGIDGLAPAEAAPVRRHEQVAAAAHVGVRDVRFLAQPDGVVQHSVDLRRRIAAEIRRFRPDVVVTTTYRLTFGDRMLNQADHRAVGVAVLDAVKDAGNRWIHPELLEEGLAPHAGVRAVLLFGSTEPTHAVDVTDHLAAGVASLAAHATYLSGLGRAFDAAEFLGRATAEAGSAVGVRHAVAFEVLSAAGV